MFGKTIEKEIRTELVPYEKTVHEHKAPTDESIKIYKELKEKAARSVTDIFKLNDNNLDGVAVFVRDKYSTASVSSQVVIRFFLNRKEHIIYKEIDPYKFKQISRLERNQKLAEYLYEAISKQIVKEVFKSLNYETRESLAKIAE